MKAKFFILTLVLVLARGCDFYSTSLWFFDNPAGEMNPLSKFLGMGWSGLIITNTILIGLIIYAFYYYSFKYIKTNIYSVSNNLTDFVSELYFNERGHFLQVFYRMPRNKKTLHAHSGYVLVRVVIVVSFIATFHNLCQFYNIHFYNTYRNIVIRPLFVIYGLIPITFFYFSYRIWKKEFLSSRESQID